MARETGKNFTELDAPAASLDGPELDQLDGRSERHPAFAELAVMRSILTQLAKLGDDGARIRVLHYLTDMIAETRVETPEQSAAIVDANLARMGVTLGG